MRTWQTIIYVTQCCDLTVSHKKNNFCNETFQGYQTLGESISNDSLDNLQVSDAPMALTDAGCSCHMKNSYCLSDRRKILPLRCFLSNIFHKSCRTAKRSANTPVLMTTWWITQNCIPFEAEPQTHLGFNFLSYLCKLLIAPSPETFFPPFSSSPFQHTSVGDC